MFQLEDWIRKRVNLFWLEKNHQLLYICIGKMSKPKNLEYKYIIIATGYNCGDCVEKSIESVISQTLENWFCILGDDGSKDNTYEIMSKYKDQPKFLIIKNDENKGACYMRHKCIKEGVKLGFIQNEDVIVHLDADDWLAGSDSLSIVDTYYQKGAQVTYGNWKKPSGQLNKLKSFPKSVLKERSYRDYKWVSTALRTFKYFLYKKIKKEHLKDKDGKWFTNCTDLAVMFPILEMADPKKIYGIKEHIYVYNSKRANSTKKRFGTQDKKKVAAKIKSLPKYY